MKQIESSAEFQEAIASNQPTVVKFYTTWCPDCKRLNTYIDDVIANHEEYRWYDMNGENFPEITDEYEVMGVPSLLVFRNGQKIAHLHSKYTKTRPEVEEFLQTLESKTR